jgi:cobalamin biosynthesis Mg chelatase CobN
MTSSPGPTSWTRGCESSSPSPTPWALHGIAERLLEAAERKLWDTPDPDTLAALRRVYLETEGDLEDR